MKYMNNDLRKLRKSLRYTQEEAADRLKISLRSYSSYENDVKKKGTAKYQYLFNKLKEEVWVYGSHGILSLDQIKEAVNETFKNCGVYFCYLFGPYATNEANGKSEVNLLISAEISDKNLSELTDELILAIHKKANVVTLKQLYGNLDLLNEILEKGIKIHG